MKILRITAFSVGITILNQRIILKDDIEFVNDFPCLLGLLCLLQQSVEKNVIVSSTLVQVIFWIFLNFHCLLLEDDFNKY